VVREELGERISSPSGSWCMEPGRQTYFGAF